MDILSRIMDLGSRFRNEDTAGAKIAASNIAVGKPAVWSKASYSHTPCGCLTDALNRHGDAKTAIAQCTADSSMHDYAKHPDWLDLMIPLNAGGVHLLADAYLVAGTFRSARELFERAAKCGWTMLESEAA